MADEYAHAVLRTACAEVVGVCARRAVDRSVRKRTLFYLTRDASDTLVDLCEGFLTRLATLSRDYAEHGGRSHVSLFDVLRALEDIGERAGGDALTLPRLMEYASVEELAPARIIPDFPVARKRKDAREQKTEAAKGGEEEEEEEGRRRRRRRQRRRKQQQKAGDGGGGDSDSESDGGAEDGDNNHADKGLDGDAGGGSSDGSGDELTEARVLAWERRVKERERKAGAANANASGGAGEGAREQASSDGGAEANEQEKARGEQREAAGGDGGADGGADVAGSGPHIAPWMPSFPPSHTYVTTPAYAQSEGRSEVEKLRKLNEQRLQVEEALARLRGTGFRAIENPYLKLPKVKREATRAAANDDARADSAAAAAAAAEHGSSREPLDSEAVEVSAGKSIDHTVKSKAERILAESGAASSSASRRS